MTNGLFFLPGRRPLHFFNRNFNLRFFAKICRKKRNFETISLEKKELKGISIPLKEKKEFGLAQNEKEEKKELKGTARGLQYSKHGYSTLHNLFIMQEIKFSGETKVNLGGRTFTAKSRKKKRKALLAGINSKGGPAICKYFKTWLCTTSWNIPCILK